MKATDIKIGKTYEVTAGRNKTKVKVANFNARTGSWECETESGKTISIKDAKRFLAEVGKKTILQNVVDTVKAVLPKGKKATLKEVIESKGITVIPKGRRATSTMRDLDDPTFTRKHHVDENGVLVLDAEDDETDNETKKERGKGGKPSGKMSALDAAHEILKEQNREMNVKEITELAISTGRWSPNGKTPIATLSAAVQMDIVKKQEASRFIKTGRGLFAAR
jgi:hypothetical protein